MSDLEILTSPLLSALPGVRHGFFTRRGGVSEGVYASLNVGRGSKDDPAAVEENRRRAAAAFDLPADRLKVAYQVHSAAISLIEEEWEIAQPPAQADGVLTYLPHVMCGVLSADCAPILLVDPKARVVTAVHAGWKGALAGVIEMAVTCMMQDGLSRAGDIVAAVGPCIGPESYEVGEDFRDRFISEPNGGDRYSAGPAAAAFFRPGANAGKLMFDLPGFVLSRLEVCGVASAEWIGRDTYAEPELFFSNRRAVHRGEGDYGRLLSAIALEA